MALVLIPLSAHAQQSLSYQDFFDTKPLSSPVSDAAFAPPAGALPPTNQFEGRLELLPPSSDVTGYPYGAIVSTTFPELRTQSAWKRLPPFAIDLVQSGDRLVPVQQGLILTGSLAWNLIVGPGRVWQQPADSKSGDHGYTRAALPFALIERGQNCVHNGSLTFLFSNSATPAISQVRYQITQETCRYMKADMWGQVAARYTRSAIPNADSIRSAFVAEMAQRVPRKPFAELAKDHPEAHLDLDAFLRGRKHPEDVTTYGVYLEGVNYASDCPTRFGLYAFCDEMRLPSYSTAKSAFAGIAMMHLGQLYSTDIYDLPLNRFLPQVGQDESWNKVSLTNALDMASGHFLSSGFEKDEDGPALKFLVDESLNDKLKDALLTYPAAAKPGTTWIYHSSDTFLATVAMQGLLQQKAGPSADLFHLVTDDIYKPLHVSQGMLTSLRTGNLEGGVPAGYFGLFYIQDDVVKLARFLNAGTGDISPTGPKSQSNPRPALDPVRLKQSLFRDPSTTGLTTPDPRQLPGTVHYNHAFWARHYTPQQYPRFHCDFWAPYMSGYGGISIVMLPNNVVFYVFSDGNEFVFNDAILEIDKLRPFCPATP